jgi:hypothetical protein
MPKKIKNPVSAATLATMPVQEPKNRNALALMPRPEEAPALTVARCLTDPATAAAGTINELYRRVSDDGEINGYIAELQQQAQTVSAGDLSRPEAMLMSQATTLNALSHSLIGWALNHVKEGGNAAYFEMCMRLGLKAQSQSRATIETLAEIKNPRQVAFVKQANIAGGNQQAHNGPQPVARENESPRNKQSGYEHELLPDGRASVLAGRVDSEMEAMAAIDGAANC